MSPPSEISEWERSGSMTPASILQRLYAKVVSYVIDEQEQAAIRDRFNWRTSISEDIKNWDKETFQTLLAQNSYPSSQPLLVEAGPIIYSSMVCLSRFPFGSTQSKDTLPINTYEDLLRAIFWMLPERACLDEPRTTSDHRKILFQSLADTGGKSDIDETEHEILGIISSHRIQYIEPPWSTYHREDFVPLARHLAASTPRPQLAISKARFTSLVRFLLAEHLNDGIQEINLELPELEDATGHIVDAFCQGSDSNEGVTWPKFEWALSERTPFLFTPIYRLLEFLVKTDSTVDSKYVAFPPPSLPPGCLLTRGAISQILVTLNSTIAFDNPDLIYQHQTSNLTLDTTSASEFCNAIKLPQSGEFDFRVVLVSGRSVAHNTPFIFGAFMQGLAPDEEIVPRYADDWERSLLFQLAPVHDVFRSNVGKRAWTSEKDAELWFGEQAAGFAMGFVNGGRRLSVVHKGGDGVYQTTTWRGDWELEIEVDKVEVWSG